MIFERLLVFLQNRPADDAVLKNLGNLFDRIGAPKELVFYHISQDYNLPHLKFSKAGFSKKSVHQSIEASLQKKLDQNVSSEMEYELIVEEGHPERMAKITENRKILGPCDHSPRAHHGR